MAETKNNVDPFLRNFFTVNSPNTEAITILSFFGVTLLSTINKSPDKIIRKNEEIYKALDLKNASAEILIKNMSKHPILLERPIVVSKNQAIIGRPPENVKDLIINFN